MLTCWNYDTQEIVASSRQGPKRVSIACFNPFKPRECLIIQSVEQINAFLWNIDEPIKNVLFQTLKASKLECEFPLTADSKYKNYFKNKQFNKEKKNFY